MNEVITFEKESTLSRSKRLKEATHAAHERLDKSITAHNPFVDRERYGLFVQVQHGFHRDIDNIYMNTDLDDLLPDLAGRRRLALIEQDLVDLGIQPLNFNTSSVFQADKTVDLPTALGWLYVAEGSNLGAAFLLKAAQNLGLSDTFGARHLGGAPEGRGLHWRTFTTALDEVRLSADEETRVITGAQTAFDRVSDMVQNVYAD